MSPLDIWLRRIGPVLIVLCLPGLIIPVVMLVSGWEDMPVAGRIVVIGGGLGSVAITAGLIAAVVWAHRRDYSHLFADDEPDAPTPALEQSLDM